MIRQGLERLARDVHELVPLENENLEIGQIPEEGISMEGDDPIPGQVKCLQGDGIVEGVVVDPLDVVVAQIQEFEGAEPFESIPADGGDLVVADVEQMEVGLVLEVAAPDRLELVLGHVDVLEFRVDAEVAEDAGCARYEVASQVDDLEVGVELDRDVFQLSVGARGLENVVAASAPGGTHRAPSAHGYR